MSEKRKPSVTISLLCISEVLMSNNYKVPLYSSATQILGKDFKIL